MKRILIVNNNMHIGGVQKALLNLLQTLHADYDITLLLFYCGGALLNEVPSDVRVCAAGGAFRYFGMTKNDVLTVHDRLLRAFLNVHPQLAGKTCVIPNFQNDAAIVRLAKAQVVNLDHRRLNVLTVARFGREKGILRALYAVAALGAQCGGMCYYLIGDGPEYATAQKAIVELGLDGTVILLGAMENPYGHMRAADVLLIPSFSEAAPMVIHEAALLGTPILTTETSSAVEMVHDTGFGWVCPNTQAGITQGLRQLLDAPQKLRAQREALDGVAFDAAAARRKFSELINGYEEDTT